MASGDFCTVSDVKQVIPIRAETTDDDSFIQRLVSSTSKAFRTYLSRDIFSAQYEEVRDGTGTDTLMLEQVPITAVAAVEIGSPPSQRRVLVADQDYTFDQTRIILLGGLVFGPGRANILVQYTAGWVAIPSDIAEKCATVTALRYKQQKQRLGQASKTLGGETVTFSTKALPEDVEQLLDQYKRTIPITGYARKVG